MIHLVHVLHSLGVGGTENGVVNLISALDGEFRHTVVSMTETGKVERGILAERLPMQVTTYHLGKQPGLDFRVPFRLAVLLRRLHPDMVHSRNWGAIDAVVAARLARVPVVIHGEHGREASDPHGLDRRRNRLRRLLAPLVDRFVTVSLDLRRWLIETVGLPDRKILTIHNGVDTRRFSENGREAGRRALGVARESLVIGTVGRLDPVKDQMTLLDAFASLTDVRSLVLIIVGDGPCRRSLEARVLRSDLAGRVTFLGERADVPILLKGLDVFVLPSLAEGISNTILEAMATGLPVVATRTGGNPELVEDGVTGMLVPVGDPGAIARAIAAYVQDPHLKVLHGKAARQRAVQRFDLGQMVDSYCQLYASLTLRKKR